MGCETCRLYLHNTATPAESPPATVLRFLLYDTVKEVWCCREAASQACPFKTLHHMFSGKYNNHNKLREEMEGERNEVLLRRIVSMPRSPPMPGALAIKNERRISTPN